MDDAEKEAAKAAGREAAKASHRRTCPVTGGSFARLASVGGERGERAARRAAENTVGELYAANGRICGAF